MYSQHVPGAKHDFNLFQRIDIHQVFLQKSHADRQLTDAGEYNNEFKLYWALLADKGYVGSQNLIRAIVPTLNPSTRSETARNERIGEGCVICENFYGRMVGLWGIISKKWCWTCSSIQNNEKTRYWY